MPNPLNNANCSDQYTDAASVQNVWNSRGGGFSVGGNSVYMQLQYGHLGMSYWTAEQLLGAGSSGSLATNCIGVRFRNAFVGSVATASAQIAQGNEPAVSLTVPGATSTVSYTVVGQGQTNGTNGVATALGSSLACVGLSVRANPTNVGIVYLGKTTVTTGNGYKLSPGNAIGFDAANVAGVYFDVATTGDGVSWMAVG